VRHAGVPLIPLVLRPDQDFDTSQRPLRHFWFVPQHTVLPQQTSVCGHEVFPQQVAPRTAQKGWEPVLQHCSKAPQEVLPQHTRPRPAQNFCPVVPVQQALPTAHDVLPQQVRPTPLQNVVPLVATQHALPVGHDDLPQQTREAATQKPGVLVVQHLCPAVQAGRQVEEFSGSAACESARLTPNAARILPARIRPIAVRACRRGRGLASMRAASSNRLPILYRLNLPTKHADPRKL